MWIMVLLSTSNTRDGPGDVAETTSDLSDSASS